MTPLEFTARLVASVLERLEQSARLREPRLDGRALRVLALLLLFGLWGRFLFSLPDTLKVRKADFPPLLL